MAFWVTVMSASLLSRKREVAFQTQAVRRALFGILAFLSWVIASPGFSLSYPYWERPSLAAQQVTPSPHPKTAPPHLKSTEIKSPNSDFKLRGRTQTTTWRLEHIKRFCNPSVIQFPHLKGGNHIRDDLSDKVEVLNGLRYIMHWGQCLPHRNPYVSDYHSTLLLSYKIEEHSRCILIAYFLFPLL